MTLHLGKPPNGQDAWLRAPRGRECHARRPPGESQYRTQTVLLPEQGGQEQQCPDGCDVPNEGTHQRDARRIEGQIGNTPPEVELGTPLRERIMPPGRMSYENERSEQRKRLEIVL